ncbi:hypothetical protein P9112_006755 [Eukaryota sp. TZLM1-RC]
MASSQSQKVDLKVVLLGSAAVGKTCLVGRFINEKFDGDYELTIGAAFAAKAVTVGDRTLRLGIWDTAGSERFEAMSRIYYRGARAAIVCYDITDKSTFDRTLFWINQLQANEPNCAVYICATKVDLLDEGHTRAVPKSAVTQIAEEVSAKMFETSAKTGADIPELFKTIVEDYVNSGVEEVSEDTSLMSLEEGRGNSGCSC